MQKQNGADLRGFESPSRSIDVSSSPADIQVAVVGCGAWGKNLVRCFAELGCLSAICDHHAATVASLASQYGCRPLPFDQILTEPSIQAVVIATQPSTHYELVKSALLSGKHVLVEKPLALQPSHAKELTILAQRLDRRLMVGHIIRYHPAFTKLQNLVARGVIGRILRIQASRMNLGAIRRQEDVLWCLGPHDVSAILALIGTEPAEVQGIGGFHLRRTVADAATLHLSFPAGEQAQINLSWLHPVKEHRLTVIGSDAMIVFDDGAPWEQKLVLYPHLVNVAGDIAATSRAAPLPVAVEPYEPLKLECRHFLECIASGREPRTDGVEGLRVTKVLSQASRTISLGQTQWGSLGRANIPVSDMGWLPIPL